MTGGTHDKGVPARCTRRCTGPSLALGWLLFYPEGRSKVGGGEGMCASGASLARRWQRRNHSRHTHPAHHDNTVRPAPHYSAEHHAHHYSAVHPAHH